MQQFQKLEQVVIVLNDNSQLLILMIFLKMSVTAIFGKRFPV